jgi:hypothetical protein
MPDIVGQAVNVGDTVLFNPPHCKGVVWGKVVRLLPKTVKISYRMEHYPQDYKRDCSRRQSEIIVLSPEQLLGIAEQKLNGTI